MDILEKIFNAGVVGAGGAGFPAHVKLNCQVEYLLINAAECEPLLYTDKYIMNTFPKEIVKATEEVGLKVSAKEIYIAVKGVNKKEIDSVSKAIKKLNSNIKIYELDNYYPAGDEQMIVYDITKRIVPPGGIPLNVGVVVSNVATILNIYEALEDKPVSHKYLTITGEVKTPSVLKVPIGISYKECIESCGGSRLKTYKVIDGGPMMGKIIGYEEIENNFVTKTTSGLIVVPDTNNFIARLSNMTVEQILNRAKSACIQCSFCSDLCPRNLIGHKIRPNMVMRHMASLDFNKELTADDILEEALICCECGICETFACPMGLSPRQVNKYVKQKLNKKYKTQQKNFEGAKFRDYRKIVPAKIMNRMGLGYLYNYSVNNFISLETDNVTIPLKQHIGAPSEPVVSVNDTVKKGQLIGKAKENALSVNIHASINGVVTNISDSISIKGGGIL